MPIITSQIPSAVFFTEFLIMLLNKAHFLLFKANTIFQDRIDGFTIIGTERNRRATETNILPQRSQSVISANICNMVCKPIVEHGRIAFMVFETFQFPCIPSEL